MIFRELLAILGTKIIISFDDYLILKNFSLSSLVKFNLDGLNLDGNDKRIFIVMFNIELNNLVYSLSRIKIM